MESLLVYAKMLGLLSASVYFFAILLHTRWGLPTALAVGIAAVLFDYLTRI